MGLYDLVAAGSRKKRKRVGRGPGSGHGGTSGRGTKGQLSRTGVSMRPTFEGGQMPLQRRLPKRGFKNPFRKVFQVVNLKDLNRFEAGSVVDPEALGRSGLIRSAQRPVKILADGELDRALTIKAQAFSKKAKEKIEAAGGKVEIIGQAAKAAN